MLAKIHVKVSLKLTISLNLKWYRQFQRVPI